MAQAVYVDRIWKQFRIGKMQHENMLRDAIVGMFRRRDRSKDDETIFWALKDISFELQQGEVIGIIGRNGSGKSTLLKVVSKIMYPTSGHVRTWGKVASLLEVGTGFHQELSGRENIYLNGSILGMKKRDVDAKIEEIVEFAGFPKFIDTPIKRYSSGMKLRLGFAVAAHLDPDVLIVDEVLAVGDVAFQKKCLDTMSQLQSGGRTVMFVSHNMEAVENLCPRSIWIDQGAVRQDGDAPDVIRDYMSTFAEANRSDVDLRNLDARTGNGKIRYTGIEFLTPEGQPTDLIRSGDSLKVRLHYEAFERIEKPHFGFCLSTEMGTLVTDLHTWGTGLDIDELPQGEGSIDFDIDFINLMPARYYVSLWIRAIGPIHFDVVENFLEFNIEPSNYYQSGRGIDKRFGLVFFPCRWHEPRLRAPVVTG